MSHQSWISGNVYHVCLCQVRIRQNPLWLWNRRHHQKSETKVSVAPKTDSYPTKIFKKKQKKPKTYRQQAGIQTLTETDHLASLSNFIPNILLFTSFHRFHPLDFYLNKPNICEGARLCGNGGITIRSIWNMIFQVFFTVLSFQLLANISYRFLMSLIIIFHFVWVIQYFSFQ